MARTSDAGAAAWLCELTVVLFTVATPKSP
jgi:hypothetical protein